ncbi:TPA: hypothetical protein ACH3X1_005016 [Trebouxia sp. C0004]
MLAMQMSCRQPSAHGNRLNRLQQLRQRCAEEVQILSREAHDMVEFYTKQQANLQAALHARCAGNAQAGTMQLAPLPPFQRHMDVSSLLSTQADATEPVMPQASAPSYGTDDDIDNVFAEFDLHDPTFTDVNDVPTCLQLSVWMLN